MMHKIVQKGLRSLNSLAPLLGDMETCKINLIKIADNLKSEQDIYSWLSIIQSLIASSKNTFGVGAIIVDENGEVIVEGHNQVFNPYFRSDLHAEMVVLNLLENLRNSDKPPINYTLYTSLEPCMMCLGRVIFSRIGKLYYVSKDLHGGPINNDHLPYALAHLMKQQIIQEASCQQALKDISAKIIAFSVQEMINNLGGTIDVV